MSFAKKAIKAIDANPVGHKLMVARRGALDALADHIEAHLDVEGLLALAR